MQEGLPQDSPAFRKSLETHKVHAERLNSFVKSVLPCASDLVAHYHALGESLRTFQTTLSQEAEGLEALTEPLTRFTEVLTPYLHSWTALCQSVQIALQKYSPPRQLEASSSLDIDVLLSQYTETSWELGQLRKETLSFRKGYVSD